MIYACYPKIELFSLYLVFQFQATAPAVNRSMGASFPVSHRSLLIEQTSMIVEFRWKLSDKVWSTLSARNGQSRSEHQWITVFHVSTRRFHTCSSIILICFFRTTAEAAHLDGYVVSFSIVPRVLLSGNESHRWDVLFLVNMSPLVLWYLAKPLWTPSRNYLSIPRRVVH